MGKKKTPPKLGRRERGKDGMNGETGARWNRTFFPSDAILIDKQGIISSRFSHDIKLGSV